jgi:NADP-dependent aldehyde dehydrogenase
VRFQKCTRFAQKNPRHGPVQPKPGFPTGVEVCNAMNHGGTYPATTDVRYKSVGTAAIQRWARPMCYQNFFADALPQVLRDENPRGVMRNLNGELTRAAV